MKLFFAWFDFCTVPGREQLQSQVAELPHHDAGQWVTRGPQQHPDHLEKSWQFLFTCDALLSEVLSEINNNSTTLL